MTSRENAKAILHYENFDHIPVVHFGYWDELIVKWREEGKMTREEIEKFHGVRSEGYVMLSKRLGFDFEYDPCVGANTRFSPCFPYKVLETTADGFEIRQNGDGLVEKVRKGAGSIPATVGTLLTGREAWEELYKPKLQCTEERFNWQAIDQVIANGAPDGGLVGLHCGSYYGFVRDMLGVEELCYLYSDDEDLYAEIIQTVADMNYACAKKILEHGMRPDYAHFWEDICFKNGPLIHPEVFSEFVGPYYKRMTDLLHSYGVDIVSVDCDGMIDKLIPVWLENGVNTMFPIEYGTWQASIEPWRKQYGKDLRGVGGMNKNVFSEDYAAIDREIERLKPLVALGGYIPCPDHRIPVTAKFENVQYYCERMRQEF